MNAIHIPKGKIVPNWIISFKNKKREKHKLKSNGFYVVRHKTGALYMYPEIDHSDLMSAKNLRNVNMKCAPFCKYGSVVFSCKAAAIESLKKDVVDSRGNTTKLPNSK